MLASFLCCLHLVSFHDVPLTLMVSCVTWSRVHRHLTKGLPSSFIKFLPYPIILSVDLCPLPSDLTEIQVAVADVTSRYEQLGAELTQRRDSQRVSLELRERARAGAETLSHWLGEREQSLVAGQAASPSRPEVVRAQAQENKVGWARNHRDSHCG